MTESLSELAAHEQLQYYTLGHGDPAYIHQYVVDAWIAQNANDSTKPIGLAFSLIGLYLHVECGRTGREVQRVHIALGKHKHAWPEFARPEDRGSMTVVQVMARPAGAQRDHAIDDWCASVWAAYSGSRQAVMELLRERYGAA